MAKKAEEKIDPTPRTLRSAESAYGFTGVARSVMGYDNQGFRNFRIVTLFIEKGVVVRTEFSDPYAAFEAMAKMELANDISVINLNDSWANGKAISK